MILTFLFRLLLFYILFIVIRSAVRTFLAYRYVKKQMEQGTFGQGESNWFEHNANSQMGRQNSPKSSGETFEAEYRVVSEDEDKS